MRRRQAAPAPPLVNLNELGRLVARVQELEGIRDSLLEQLGTERQRPPVALAIVVEKMAPGEVLGQWIEILRRRYWPGPTYTHRAYNVIEGRNRITTRALEQRDDWQVFYWTDSDMLPDPGLIDRLEELCRHPSFLAKDGGVIVGPYYNRELPFEVQLYQENPLLEGMKFLRPDYWTRCLMEAKQNYLGRRPSRLIKVGGGGTGSMLIRRDVLERMQQLKGRGGIWEMPELPAKLVAELRRKGEDKPGARWGEDILFCHEVRYRLGVQVWADTDLRLTSGHVRTDIVGPDHYLAAHTVPERVILDTDAVRRQIGYEPLHPEPAGPAA